MNSQKHFNYVAENPVSILPIKATENVEIVDVTFFTPARISLKLNDVVWDEDLSIDLFAKAAYLKNGEKAPYSDKIFAYLDSINELDADFFAGNNDQYKQVMKDHDSMKDEVSNG